MDLNLIVIAAYLFLIILNSVIAVIMYFHDKKLAVKGLERTKEKDLLFIAVFFGGVGSLIGRVLAHHKTDKKYFSVVIYFSVLMEIVTLGALIAIYVM